MSDRVLFVNQTGRFGGAERVLFDLLSRLDRQRIQPILVCPKGDMQQAAVELDIDWIEVKEFQEIDTTRKSFKGRDIFNTISLFRKLNRIISDTKPALIYTNSVKSHLLVNLKSRKTPTLVRLHDFPGSFDGLSKRLLKYSLGNSHSISCVSRGVKDDVNQLLNRNDDTVSTLYNGYEHKAKEANHHFAKRIVIAGWLMAWKGFDVFVDAMELVAEQLPEWEFVIAGEAASDVRSSVEYAELLRKRVTSSPHANRFKLHGGYRSLDEVTCCADHTIFVHASIKPDPLPTVILEASGLELPVVCSEMGGGKEIIQHGKSGYTISPTVNLLAEHVLKLARDQNQRISMARSAYANCLHSFAMDRYVNEMTDLIIKQIKRSQ